MSKVDRYYPISENCQECGGEKTATHQWHSWNCILRPDFLSLAQAEVLLYKFNTGEFGQHLWPTVQALFSKGMIVESENRIAVTAKGKAWCLANHLNFR